MAYDVTTKYKAIVHYTHFLRSLRKVAKIYNVTKSTLGRWVNRDGKQIPNAHKPRHHSKVTRVKKQLMEYYSRNKCSILRDAIKTLGIQRCVSTVCRHMKSVGLTRKRCTRIVSPGCLDESAFEEMRSTFMSDQNVIAIDESCIHIHDTPKYGWAPKGQRVRQDISKKQTTRRRVTLVLAISRTGIAGMQIIDGSCDSHKFAEFISHLKAPPGSTCFMDNVKTHHTLVVKQAAIAKGYTITYSASYSPWYNPVEYVFSTIKSDFRKENQVIQGGCIEDAIVRVSNIAERVAQHGFNKHYDHVKKLLSLSPQQAAQR